jgi:hypothetical protein
MKKDEGLEMQLRVLSTSDVDASLWPSLGSGS